MSKKPILAAQFFKSNAEIIEACVALRFLKPTDLILDPTYGGGKWWKTWQPSGIGDLVKHDLKLDGTDFRNTDYEDEQFDVCAYDPPYVSVGGRATTTIREMYEAYGLTGAPTSPEKLQALINDGLDEMWRVLKPGGYCLVKCMNYISSGKYHPGIVLTTNHALSLGFEMVDQFVHVKKSGGPQPGNRTRAGKNGKRVKSKQKHSRNNYSVLIVLRKKP